MTQYGFYFNGPRCTGCKTCVMACKDYKDLDTECSYRQVYEYGAGDWSQNDAGLWENSVYAYYVTTACNHCENPACVASCPQGSMQKDEETGLVFNDAETCIGCGTCATACPYEIPKINEEKTRSMKCDGCYDLVAAGKTPICVESCPLRALEFGDIEELREKYGETAAIAPLPDPSMTGPSVVITAPKNARDYDDADGSVLNLAEII